MPRKKMHDASRTCSCTVCGLIERSLPGTYHRRCGGKPGAPPRAKHSYGGGSRGRWT